ncbi:MAG: hypothetical protein CL526_07730 [Aequorivita sp.]|nr:hypothetical protein [Aequorivita sp.]|tara:strand:+ start:9334 stop:10038 length:705 start_codon:yes stop_codon:yes gene_type:complete
MKAAIMQPYIFPYLGYFQLIKAVDAFVFYDDVNFIKRGWINRNKILLNNKEKLISFPCIGASQNKLINEVQVDLSDKQYLKLIQTIEQAYNKAPYYKEVYPIIEKVFNSSAKNIAELAIHSIKIVSEYIGINTEFYVSSESFGETKGIDKADRLIAISKNLGSNTYINALGGIELYNKAYFKLKNIELHFLKPSSAPYKQHDPINFIAGLSIIDVMMFNSPEEINEMLDNFELV